MDQKNDGVYWAGLAPDWLIAEEPKPAKKQEELPEDWLILAEQTAKKQEVNPRDTMPRFASFAHLMPEPSPVTDFSAFAVSLELKEYKQWILDCVECAENDKAQGYSDSHYRGRANILLKAFREKCAARLEKAKADMNDPFALFPDAEITALSDLGLPEASFLYVEKYANPYQWNVWDDQHLERLELAVRFGFSDGTMTQKAQKMLGDLYWKTGKVLHDKGKPEGMERIRKAETYGNAEAKKFLAPPPPPEPLYVWEIPSFPRETLFRHYATNEKIFELDGKYYTESGKEVGFGELD